MSQTRMHLSIEEHITHFESGYEKHISVILFSAACLNSLTLVKPDLAFTTYRVRSVRENAMRSLSLL